MQAFGLRETAVKFEGRTLLGMTDWEGALQRAIEDPLTKFTLSLDGLPGSSTLSQITGAVQRGASGMGTATEWEFAQLDAAGRLLQAGFVRAGHIIEDAFG
jgi:hypothetical protein